MVKSILKSPWIFLVLPLSPLLILALFFGSRYLNELGNLPVEFIQCPDVAGGCGNHAFNIHFSQVPQVMKPFNVSLEAAAEEAYVSFAMQGMAMGLNRYRLIKTAENRWQAEVTLPVCVQGQSHWSVMVELKTSAALKPYQFEFDTLR